MHIASKQETQQGFSQEILQVRERWAVCYYSNGYPGISEYVAEIVHNSILKHSQLQEHKSGFMAHL